MINPYAHSFMIATGNYSRLKCRDVPHLHHPRRRGRRWSLAGWPRRC